MDTISSPEGLPLVQPGSESWLAFNPLAWINDDEDNANGLSDDMLQGRDPEWGIARRSSLASRDGGAPMENEDHDEIELEAPGTFVEAKPEEGRPAPEALVRDTAPAEDSAVSLGVRLSIRDAEGLRQVLLIQLSSKACVRLDCSKVESADASALQLLTAFYREAGHRGVKVHWHEPSDALRQSAALLGLSEELDLGKEQDKA